MDIKETIKSSLSNGDLVPVVQYAQTHLFQVISAIEDVLLPMVDHKIAYNCVLAIAFCKKLYNANFSSAIERFYAGFKEVFIFNT